MKMADFTVETYDATCTNGYKRNTWGRDESGRPVVVKVEKAVRLFFPFDREPCLQCGYVKPDLDYT